MKEIETSIEIDATPDQVWDVLGDGARWAEWNPFMRRLAGNFRAGEKVTLEFSAPGHKPMTIRPTVLEVNDGRALRWLGRFGIPGIFDGEHRFELEPIGNGRTRLTHAERFRGILVPFLGGVLRDTSRGFQAMNEALKARVEGKG